MLVLIAGITGMVGQPCAYHALAKGHKVRGLGRSPDKLDAALTQKLEGFEKSSSIYDIDALDRAVKGVDAIVSAYTDLPEVVVEGQLLLLRAAERAGVKIFHAASWNYDWTKGQLGQHETYDCYISFWNHVRISSSIKPIYGFTGIIPDYMFYSPTQNPLNKDEKTLIYFGDGTKELIWTTADDLAAFSIEAISSPKAAEGGFYRVDSFRKSLLDVVKEYEAVRDVTIERKRLGSLEDVDNMLDAARSNTDPTLFLEYIGLAYLKYMIRGTWDYESVDNDRWSNVKRTSIHEWFVKHPDV